MLDRPVLDRLDELAKEHEDVIARLGDPTVLSDQRARLEASRRHKVLDAIVTTYRDYQRAAEDLGAAREMLHDAAGEDREMLRFEMDDAEAAMERLADELRVLLLPRDPNDDKNVIVEIRGAEGGEEANLFAKALFEMYSRYADRMGWKLELLGSDSSPMGGFNEVTFLVKGDGVWSRMKHEGGPHRVQRVPATESQGRVHTSSATVTVLPEAEEVDVHIDEKDLKIDVYRSTGPGGQSVNTTDSAVRITHLPSGLVVTCQDEKSQHKNKAKALRVLRARLYDLAEAEREKELAATRRSMVGTGDRSEKIRTYNFPESRVTDHRIKLTVHQLPRVLDGDLDIVVEPLLAEEQQRRLLG